MKKTNKINKIQKKQIEKFYKTVNDEKKYYGIDKEEIMKQIREIIKLELSENYPEYVEQVRIVSDEDSPKESMYSGIRKINEKGELEEEYEIKIVLGHLNSRLAYQASQEELTYYCERLIKYLFHEIQHLKQDLDVDKNESSKYLLTMVREDVIVERKHNMYDNNYRNVALENDAERTAHLRYMEIMGEDEESIKQAAKNNMLYEIGEYINENKEILPRDEALKIELDKLIVEEKDSELFKLYPPLLKIYNQDCTKKSALELIDNMEKEKQELRKDKKRLNDSQEMYYELISEVISKNEDVKEIRNVYGKEYTNELIKNICKYFESEKQRKIDIIKETQEICTNKTINYNEEIKKCENIYDKKIKILEAALREKNSFKDSLKISPQDFVKEKPNTNKDKNRKEKVLG